jgi:hypothetical protein
MRLTLPVAVALLALSGCAGRSLPYEPVHQPPGGRVSAAYSVVGDRLRIEVDTGGRSVEEMAIVKPDGTEIRPAALEFGPASPESPGSVGVGVGGSTWGGNRGIGGFGTGVSIGIPIGGGGGGPRSAFAWFPLDEAGSAPWQIRVKAAGLAPVLIDVGTGPQ